MDCFFHHAVPSVAPCTTCRKPLCATCRGTAGDCPSCRLAARIDAAKAERAPLGGDVGPSRGTWREPQPEPQPHRRQWAPPPPRVVRTGTLADVRPATRALVALGYPFWPLALLALFDTKAPFALRRQAWQALGFNAGIYGFGALLGAIASVPIIGIGAWPLIPFIVPVAIVASVVYAFRVWNGDDVDVPIVGEWIDARLSSSSSSRA